MKTREIEISESDILLLTRVANALESANKKEKSDANKFLLQDLRTMIDDLETSLED
jgi:hypothetical protein